MFDESRQLGKDVTPSAPEEDAPHLVYCEPFQRNLYPKLDMPEFDSQNYKINRIMCHYNYLDKEIKARNNLKKKYTKVSSTTFGIECLVTVVELGAIVSSLAVPILIPLSAPISVGLTTTMALLRSSSGLLSRKINKHAAIELLARSKLDSIEEKFYKAIKDGKLTDEEFNDIEQEVKNYNKMKQQILGEFQKGKKQASDVGNEIKMKLIEKGKTMGRDEVMQSFKKYIA